MTVLPEEALEAGAKPVNLSPTFDDSTLEAPVRERFLRNLRAVEAVLAGATVVDAAREHQIARSTLSRLVQRTRTLGVLAAGMSLWQSRVLARRWGFAICGMRHPARRGRLVGGAIPCWP